MTDRLHATCVTWDGAGILLRGPSGSGKSDLALRAIALGAALVADDQVLLGTDGDGLLASPPDSLAGLLEVRGLGILRVDHLAPARLRLVVDLIAEADLDRLPPPDAVHLLGHRVPLCRLAPWQTSAPLKLHLALRLATGTILSLS